MEGNSDNKIIFSPYEGFWNDNDGWVFCPSTASPCPDLKLGEQVSFIGIDDAIVVKKDSCNHLDEEGALSKLYESFSQYNGDVIATLFSEMTGDKWQFLRNNCWRINDSVGLYDEQHLEEILLEQADISQQRLLDLLNTHCSGTFYDDNHGGYYHHDPTSVTHD